MTLIFLNNIFDQFKPAHINIFSLTIVSIVIISFWLATNFSSHIIPNRTHLINNIISFIKNNMLPDSNTPWTNILLPLFFSCLSYNLISLIPYSFSHTAHFSFTFSISIPFWIMLNVLGIINNWAEKLSHLVPQGTPSLLIPLMIIIELISLCIQPLTLGFRLGANILAGHLLIFLCSCFVWTTINNSILGITLFIFIIILLLLEIAVAFIQAAVFTILTNQYLQENN